MGYRRWCRLSCDICFIHECAKYRIKKLWSNVQTGNSFIAFLSRLSYLGWSYSPNAIYTPHTNVQRNHMWLKLKTLIWFKPNTCKTDAFANTSHRHMGRAYLCEMNKYSWPANDGSYLFINKVLAFTTTIYSDCSVGFTDSHEFQARNFVIRRIVGINAPRLASNTNFP